LAGDDEGIAFLTGRRTQQREEQRLVTPETTRRSNRSRRKYGA
jgi:hypothetical protein